MVSQHSTPDCYSLSFMGRGHRFHRLLAAAAGLSIVASVVVLPTEAGADAVSDKQAQANLIASKISELDHTIEKYAEAANGAQLELDALTQRVADGEANVAAAQAQRDQHVGELRSYAIDAYVHGIPSDAADVSNSGDLLAVGQRQGYLSAASGNRQTLIDQLRATEEDVKVEIDQLHNAQAQATAKKNDLDGQKASAQGAVEEQKRLYNQAQGELATLVKAAQEKKAAEQAAAAQARARQPVPTATGGGASGGGPPPAVNGSVADVIAEARKQVGKPYVWGASGPDSFDCSGLTMWAWRAGGVNLPHFSGAQYSATTHIPLSQIQPGDLIFYESPNQHVALYIGGGQIIQAINSNRPVEYNSLYFWDTAMYASRP
jgi:cell wall-associated NlpC family hydrolase